MMGEHGCTDVVVSATDVAVSRQWNHLAEVALWSGEEYAARGRRILWCWMEISMQRGTSIRFCAQWSCHSCSNTTTEPYFNMIMHVPTLLVLSRSFCSNVIVLPWPVRSPDLSPFEHLWDHMGRQIRARVRIPRNRQELAQALREELAKNTSLCYSASDILSTTSSSSMHRG